jgi:hypothetical protein
MPYRPQPVPGVQHPHVRAAQPAASTDRTCSVKWLRAQIAAFRTFLDDVEAFISRDTELDA